MHAQLRDNIGREHPQETAPSNSCNVEPGIEIPDHNTHRQVVDTRRLTDLALCKDFHRAEGLRINGQEGSPFPNGSKYDRRMFL